MLVWVQRRTKTHLLEENEIGHKEHTPQVMPCAGDRASLAQVPPDPGGRRGRTPGWDVC